MVGPCLLVDPASSIKKASDVNHTLADRIRDRRTL